MRNSELLRNLIRRFETDSWNVVREFVRISAHLFDGFLSVSLVDPHRSAGADAIRVQENHDITNDFLLRPGVFDPAPAHGTDAFDVFEPARFVLDNLKYFLSEFL